MDLKNSKNHTHQNKCNTNKRILRILRIPNQKKHVTVTCEYKWNSEKKNPKKPIKIHERETNGF